jgi:uncharacterized protein YgbK (DUF1537 family)
LARAAHLAELPLVYKKTDSTLRGNIGAELAALVEASAGAPLLYAPAYPPMGRTVREGTLFVDGIPVGETWIAKDPLNPVRESYIPALLSAQCSMAIFSRAAPELANPAPWTISVGDGERNSDVEAAAQAVAVGRLYRLAAGPAGFAGHLARLLDLPRQAVPSVPRIKSALVVNGSMNEVSLRQVEVAKDHGLPSMTSQAILADERDDLGWIILDCKAEDGDRAIEFSERIAADVRRILLQKQFDALVVFGGDTAFAIVGALGLSSLLPRGELFEGIPISSIACGSIDHHSLVTPLDFSLITKAGGFGSPGILSAIRERVSNSNNDRDMHG